MAAGQPRKPTERMSEALPDHSSLTRIRQRWGSDRFRAIFARVVRDCQSAGIVSGDVVPMDATLIRADVSLGSLVAQHLDAVDLANLDEEDRLSRSHTIPQGGQVQEALRDQPGGDDGDELIGPTAFAVLQAAYLSR